MAIQVHVKRRVTLEDPRKPTATKFILRIKLYIRVFFFPTGRTFATWMCSCTRRPWCQSKPKQLNTKKKTVIASNINCYKWNGVRVRNFTSQNFTCMLEKTNTQETETKRYLKTSCHAGSRPPLGCDCLASHPWKHWGLLVGWTLILEKW